MPGKCSPKDPDDIGKVVKPVFELPNTDLGPLFSSSTLWLGKGWIRADVVVLLAGFEKTKFELVTELLVA